MSNEDYRYVTTQLYSTGSPNPVICELPFTNVNFTSQISSIGTFTGEVLLSGIDTTQYNVDQGTTPGLVGFYVYKGNNPVWSGVLWTREWDSQTQLLKITAQDMLSYYQHRIISGYTGSSYYNANAGGSGIGGLVYTNVDPITILSDILTGANAASHGNIGVTKTGSSSSGATVSRTYFDFEKKTVYQAWKDLSTSSTLFDFLITPSVSGGLLVNYLQIGSPVFGVTYDATSHSSTNFNFPGNLDSYSFVEDGTRVANHLYGIGYGANQNRIIAAYYDADKIAGAGTWPLLEATTNYIDIISVPLLDLITQGKLGAISYPPTTIQVVIPSYIDPIYNPNTSGYYNLGDQVKLTITDDRFPSTSSSAGLQGIYRIVAIDVLPGENGPDKITLTLNLPLATNIVAG